MDRLLTTHEVAQICRTAPETLRYWRHVGKGPVGFKLGRRTMYRESDVRAYLDRAYQEAVEDQVSKASA